MFEKIKFFKIVNNNNELILPNFLHGYTSCDFEYDKFVNIYKFHFTFLCLDNYYEYLQNQINIEDMDNRAVYIKMITEIIRGSYNINPIFNISKHVPNRLDAFRKYTFKLNNINYYTTDNMTKGHIIIECCCDSVETITENDNDFVKLKNEPMSYSKHKDDLSKIDIKERYYI